MHRAAEYQVKAALQSDRTLATDEIINESMSAGNEMFLVNCARAEEALNQCLERRRLNNK